MTDRTPLTTTSRASVVVNTNIMKAGPRYPALAALKADCVIIGGRVMDPATGLDELADIAVDNGRIIAVETAEAGRLRELDTKQRIDATGKIVCPGLIDIHTHVYEWVTNFGINADDAGGGIYRRRPGSRRRLTFAGFEPSIQTAATDVRAFMYETGQRSGMPVYPEQILRQREPAHHHHLRYSARRRKILRGCPQGTRAP
jgi:hypothetical protein